ncbi:hypothetical protein [Poseidonocella sp. HB161398]|uniref:hypothetical protein n=1 Tax=Poseidonocella sp. HB161398 TaxID=2320855 RepID=UPI0011083E08|nr:hypothetical protein [Poseidonocella sp. HB161398]
MPDGSFDNKFTANIALWETLRPVDRSYTKPITGKSYKGDSPNPTYIIMKLTEALGPIGARWGFNVVRETVREGVPHSIIVEQEQEMDTSGSEPRMKSKRVRYEIIREQHHQLEIEFWLIDRESGERRSFSAFGGTPMVYMAKSGKWIVDEDAAKKSLTDAYTKAASWLGACADIFLGIFDDKYTSQPHNAPGMDGPPQQQSRQDYGPQGGGGWDAQGEHLTGQTQAGRDPADDFDRVANQVNREHAERQQQARQPDHQRQTSTPSGW